MIVNIKMTYNICEENEEEIQLGAALGIKNNGISWIFQSYFRFIYGLQEL